jgi:putative ABC transport system permease protein
MTGPGVPPPRLAERLLAAALGGGDWTESVLGDLHEEHLAYASRSRFRAAIWYWLQVLRLAARGLAAHTLRRSQAVSYIEPDVPPQPSGDNLMRTLGIEVRHASRSILSRPAMSAIVVVTLGLGLGANAAVFSMIDALVLRPFTMRDVDRITMLSYARPDSQNRREALSLADFLDLRKQSEVFERLAGFQWWDANLVGQDEPEHVQGFHVSADFFPALGVQPAVGRGFLPEEETTGRHRRVVLGHGLWQRRFASDSSIVGRSIEIDGEQHEVVGIAPPAFDFPMGAQLWAPMAFDAEAAANRRSLYITAIGRLAPGRTLEEAKAQMAAVGERLAREHPDTNLGRELRVYTIGDGMMDIGLGSILTMWQASACFVLLIACANVANLLLARGAERQREMAVRLAIGASRARVVRELLIESGLLALAAVPAALAVTWIGLKLITAYMPAKIARFVAGWYQMDVDLRLVAFTSALAILTALIFGLIPAIQASRPRLAETLKEGGRSATTGGARLRLRRGLVVAEMALALPLLVAAALSVLTVHRFLNGPQGFNPEGVLTMRLLLPEARYPDNDARSRFAEQAVDRLRATPGVVSAAAVNIMPASDNNSGRSIEIDGSPNPDPANPPSVDYRTATPEIFTALQIPIRAGRAFTDGDRSDTQPVAIVSESLARRYWPNTDALGKRIKFRTGPWLTVVGISGDHIHGWFNRRNYPTLYRPFRQAPTNGMALVVRTSRDPSTLAADARVAIRAVDSSQSVFELQPMRKTLEERTLGLQYVGAVMLVFGGLALLLAVIGVYGIMAHMVTQRTHEIGVRMALGATRRDVLQITVGQAGRLTAIGVGLGVVLSILLGRFIEAGLLGVASNDARITAGLAAILVASSLAAGYLPARRAASIDPTVALRGD